jgi:GNAT superfamily N-acetyltransferase
VPATTPWWMSGVDYLGRLAIRHRLTPLLLEVGGHIGYNVRPSARRRGYATAMFRAALPIAHRLGTDPVLITCDEDNAASRRVAEANGALYQDQRGVKFHSGWLRRNDETRAISRRLGSVRSRSRTPFGRLKTAGVPPPSLPGMSRPPGPGWIR